MVKRPRPLDAQEIESLLALDVPARLATLDRDAYPHVTPIWFVWSDAAFHMTSIDDRPHIRRLNRNPCAGLCIDIEDPERPDGERPNRQIRAVGHAELFTDRDGEWTRRITRKYLNGPGAEAAADDRAADRRVVTRLRPQRLVAVASV